MERPLSRTEEREQALITELAKAVQAKNFERYFELIEKEPLEKQKQLCDANLDLGNLAHQQKKALHFAAEQGNTDAVRKLLELGAYVNDFDTDHMTPFLYAAENGDPALLAFLVEKGAHRTTHDDSGMTALHWAAAGNHVPAITALVKHYHLAINAAHLCNWICKCKNGSEHSFAYSCRLWPYTRY